MGLSSQTSPAEKPTSQNPQDNQPPATGTVTLPTDTTTLPTDTTTLPTDTTTPPTDTTTLPTDTTTPADRSGTTTPETTPGGLGTN